VETKSAMNESGANWVRGLPARWALGGSVLGIVWSLVSSFAQGSFSNPLGGLAAGLSRSLVLIVLPLCVLGFLWGWSEKLTLERCSAEGEDRLKEAIRRSALRQTGKAMMCGIIFGVFTYGLGLFRSFRPWDSDANIKANISSVFAFALLAAPVGILVGILSKRNLLRRLFDDRGS
jgi:hypothetical protein